MRRIVLFGAILAMGISAVQARTLDRQETDSVASALATVWGEYVKGKAAAYDGDAKREYLRGIHELTDNYHKNDTYLKGLVEGAAIVSRIMQIENTGRINVDMEKFGYKLDRAVDGKNTGFTTSTAEAYVNRLMKALVEEIQIVEDSPAYLNAMAKRHGITRTPSGLLFEVISEGDGDKPGVNDLVKFKYTGKFINGRVFNETEPGKAMTSAVKDMIPGFSEGLQMMSKGGKYRLYIPSEIGYGANGVSGLIPGGAATIFDVELTDILHVDAQASPAE